MKFRTLIAILALSGCANSTGTIDDYLTKRGLSVVPTTENIEHCHGYGCKFKSEAALSPKDWRKIESHFKPKPKTPAAEREAMKAALGTFETIVGAQTGTQNDQWGTFRKLGDDQHDCVDESINASIYMKLLKDKGLMRLHTIGAPQARFPIVHAGRWPHQAATIREIETGEYFIVDTWWEDNGKPAHIVPLDEWKSGWRADDP